MARGELDRLIRRHCDTLLAAAIALTAQVEVWTADTLTRGEQATIGPLALVAAFALIWRRRAPLLVLGVLIGVVFTATRIVPVSGEDPIALQIAFVVAIYSVGAYSGGVWAVAGAAATLALAIVITATDPESATLGAYVFFTLVAGGPWLAGRAIRRRRLSERHLEHRARTAEREREQRARAAVAEERMRIARELHDVVAHAISVIVLQARGGRRLLDAEPDEARGAFDTIESQGQQALVEMRRLLGMLRKGDEEIALAPQPGLASLGALAERVSAAGLPVEVTVQGERRELPPGVDLSGYRIVQEALTNALKHAGPATARVVVSYGDDELAIEVLDTAMAAGPVPATDSSGCASGWRSTAARSSPAAAPGVASPWWRGFPSTPRSDERPGPPRRRPAAGPCWLPDDPQGGARHRGGGGSRGRAGRGRGGLGPATGRRPDGRPDARNGRDRGDPPDHRRSRAAPAHPYAHDVRPRRVRV